jgi:ADP-ribose pyrophosphatase YjhB (NUDIX family)
MFCQRCGSATSEQERDGRLRPVCDACGAVTYLDPKVAVAVVVADEERILLGKRAEWTRNPGTWSFPSGFVERGEVVEQAAIRETREETGLTVEVGTALGVISEPGEPVILIPYPAIAVSGEPTAGDDLTELAWFALDALPRLAFDHDADILRMWQDWRGSRQVSPA